MAAALQAAVPRPHSAAQEQFLLEDKEANNTDVVRRAEDGDRMSVPWFTWLGFLILTFNSGMAIVRSQGDVTAIAFVGFSYADLLALFACRIAVWVLTTLLTFAFSSKVAAVMPPTVAVIVWLMAFATVAGAFIAFFVCKEK